MAMDQEKTKTEEQEFIAALEREFKNRYTFEDEEYKLNWERQISEPPVCADWNRREMNRDRNAYHGRYQRPGHADKNNSPGYPPDRHNRPGFGYRHNRSNYMRTSHIDRFYQN